MNEKRIQKCRTCLKDSTKTFPLTNPARGCTPKVTYVQFLKEYAQIEYNADYEYHMPQYLCFLCCRQLTNAYVFIRQAQNCNLKLISVITKQIDCLREQAIDLPQMQEQTSISIKKENISNIAILEDPDYQDFITTEEENSKANITLIGDLITERVEQAKHNIEENLEEGNNNFKIETNKNTRASASTEASTILYKSDIPETTESLLDEVQYPTCNKLITKHDNLINHMRIHCHVTNISPSKLSQRLSPSSKNQTFACTKCPCKYSNKYKYLNHVKDKHDSKEVTNATDNKIEKLRNKVIKCQSCDYTAKSYAALNYHNRSKHGTESDKIKCKFCSYTSFKKCNLLVHVKNVHKELIKTLKANTKSKTDKSISSNNNLNNDNCTSSDFLTTPLDEENSLDYVEHSSEDDIPLAHTIIQSSSKYSSEVEQEKEEFSDEDFIRNILNMKKRPRKILLTKSLTRRCNECGNICKNYKSLCAHKRSVHISSKEVTNAMDNNIEKPKHKVIKCQSCDYTAKSYAALNYHNRSKHGTESDKLKCKFCSYTSFKKCNLLVHVKNVHKELIKTLKADTKHKTDESISSINNLNKDNCTTNDFVTTPLDEENSLDHEYSSEDDIPLAHTMIQSSSKYSSEVKQEKEEFSDEDFIRNILNMKKRPRKSLSTTSLARRCDECGNIYKNYKSLSAHKRSVHISEDKFSLCPHCGKKYKRKIDLRIHIEKTHAATKGAEFVKKPTIPKTREKRFMCTECSYVCTTITILNIHRNRHHTGEKPYKCDICYKSFIVPYDLKVHRYLHTGERPYKCSVCCKGFRDNSHMLKHKRIHTNERPYKCNDCGKSFTQSYNLSVHKRTHLKEKKLNCTICGKLFENQSMLNIHRINENHHDEVL